MREFFYLRPTANDRTKLPARHMPALNFFASPTLNTLPTMALIKNFFCSQYTVQYICLFNICVGAVVEKIIKKYHSQKSLTIGSLANHVVVNIYFQEWACNFIDMYTISMATSPNLLISLCLLEQITKKKNYYIN